MLEQITASDHATIELVVLNGSLRPRVSLLRRVAQNRHHLLYIAYTWIDQRVFRGSPDAFDLVDVSTMLDAIPQLSVQPHRTRFVDRFAPADIQRLRATRIDVFLRLGFRILKGEVLDAARYGVWSFHHGDPATQRGGPAAFWEVFQRSSVTGSVLQRLTEDLDGGVVLYRSFSATDPSSVHRNKNNLYWKSLSFVPRSLRQLRQASSRHPAASNGVEGPRMYSGPLYRTPRNGEFARLLLKHVGRGGLRRIRQAISPSDGVKWVLLSSVGSDRSRSLRSFRVHRPPRGRFWADPHVIRRDGRWFIFFEDYSYAEQRGRISFFSVDDDGRASEPQLALERPFHLSYPFVFEWRSDLFMVPETSENRTIEIYRCQRFPDQWTYLRTIMRDVAAVDATLFEGDDRWWLFANMREHEGASTWDELFLFHSSDPLSEDWTPHPQNPIVSDVRCSRPAGRLFRRDGRLFRPSQDCSRGYGYGIRFNEVLRLTSSEYEEVERERIEPHWDRKIVGIHTWNEDGPFAVADARVKGILGSERSRAGSHRASC
jgi:hypothetical protein